MEKDKEKAVNEGESFCASSLQLLSEKIQETSIFRQYCSRRQRASIKSAIVVIAIVSLCNLLILKLLGVNFNNPYGFTKKLNVEANKNLNHNNIVNSNNNNENNDGHLELRPDGQYNFSHLNQPVPLELIDNAYHLKDLWRTYGIRPPSIYPYDLESPLENPSSAPTMISFIQQLLQRNDNVENGFFVEVYAGDGETLSNTLTLEKDFGWTGLLIEPDEMKFQHLMDKERKCWKALSCVSTKDMPEIVFRRKQKRLEELETYQDEENRNVPMPVFKNFKGIPIKGIPMACYPIYSFLGVLDVTIIDYFSLNTRQGNELRILEAIPFHLLIIKVLSVTFNKIPGGLETNLRPFMDSMGYRYIPGKIYGSRNKTDKKALFVLNSLYKNSV